MNAGSFSVDELAPTTATTKATKGGVEYLSLAPGQRWQRPLRGSADAVQFVSFSIYASPSTVIRIGDVWLGISSKPGAVFAEVMAGVTGRDGIDWRPLAVNLQLDSFGGSQLAALPTFTVRIDPPAGVWDLYLGANLMIEDLPFHRGTGVAATRHFDVLAGARGAWILGLVMAAENPLYEDANRNAIDDTFEHSRRGNLLSAQAPASERKTLIQDWRIHQRRQRPPSLFAKGIVPDPRSK